jgi:hypothetical protein
VVNAPPLGGSFDISPKFGYSFNTSYFLITHSNS